MSGIRCTSVLIFSSDSKKLGVINLYNTRSIMVRGMYPQDMVFQYLRHYTPLVFITPSDQLM